MILDYLLAQKTSRCWSLINITLSHMLILQTLIAHVINNTHFTGLQPNESTSIICLSSPQRLLVPDSTVLLLLQCGGHAIRQFDSLAKNTEHLSISLHHHSCGLQQIFTTMQHFVTLLAHQPHWKACRVDSGKVKQAPTQNYSQDACLNDISRLWICIRLNVKVVTFYYWSYS